jgi:hypothetical protein
VALDPLRQHPHRDREHGCWVGVPARQPSPSRPRACRRRDGLVRASRWVRGKSPLMRLTLLVRGSIWTANVVMLLQSGALFAMWFFVLPYLQESTGTRRTRRDSPPVSSTRRARSVARSTRPRSRQLLRRSSCRLGRLRCPFRPSHPSLVLFA